MRSHWKDGVPPGATRAARIAYEYLRLRLHQLREDVARGAGPMVDGLAGVVNVRREHVPHFGRVLRSHQGELLALADSRTLTPPRALELMRRVGALVLEDPLLRGDLEAAMGAYEAR